MICNQINWNLFQKLEKKRGDKRGKKGEILNFGSILYPLSFKLKHFNICIAYEILWYGEDISCSGLSNPCSMFHVPCLFNNFPSYIPSEIFLLIP